MQASVSLIDGALSRAALNKLPSLLFRHRGMRCWLELMRCKTETGEELTMADSHITLNASQRHRLMITCKHIDQLLGDIEATLNATASKGVFGSYVSDITPTQRKTIEDYIARLRGRLLQVLASQSLAPEGPHISAAHSIEVGLTFIEVAIEELAPRYMRGYGPVSQEGAADLNAIMEELQTVSKELHRYVRQLPRRKEQAVPDCE